MVGLPHYRCNILFLDFDLSCRSANFKIENSKCPLYYSNGNSRSRLPDPNYSSMAGHPHQRQRVLHLCYRLDSDQILRCRGYHHCVHNRVHVNCAVCISNSFSKYYARISWSEIESSTVESDAGLALAEVHAACSLDVAWTSASPLAILPASWYDLRDGRACVSSICRK